MERNIIFFIRYAPLTILPLIVAGIFYIIISGYKIYIENSQLAYKESLIEREKAQVKTNVNLAVQIYKNQIFLTAKKEQHNKTFLNLLKSLNNKTNDYYFIFDTNGNVIIHSFLTHLEGENLFIFEDENYNKVIKQITTDYQKDRFLEYLWLNPKTNRLEDKISFVKQIPETNYILGSGFYISDIERQSRIKDIQDSSIYEENIYITLVIALIFIILAIILAFIISNILLRKFNFLVKQKNDLEKESLIDPLTKLNNRVYFSKTLDKYLNNIEEEVFSLIIFDIDDFKDINRDFSYDFGDNILKEISILTKNSLPNNVEIFRIGGDRFAIILPNTNLNESYILAKRLKNNCEGKIFDKVEKVTISLGIIEASVENSSHEILRKIELAIFKAKKDGKNRVIAYKN
ncbi:sensor domain-containing diguanylate cyclase [Aliarcobacter thereius]|uniref:diguanylate cyclase n=1 Tax=Aliarcobacter thereius LMG 24486 TaxID=1032240 RepID=A0A1C7WRM5_9BACT|nr:diguanylate cyclase [Aliarcobacter thereius]OCL89781.1 Response regulator PleD [Aliarcobacter thereius]OCL96431.1 Response regulator PleD [Aliarcobacter thereius LMG 24486]QBF15607.1 Cache sensor-containing diguanylate cyclase [Aliarcobacter thereius LMG 24486]TLS91703.1 diguanylate cyclase [Aliarcobacter thereius]